MWGTEATLDRFAGRRAAASRVQFARWGRGAVIVDQVTEISTRRRLVSPRRRRCFGGGARIRAYVIVGLCLASLSVYSGSGAAQAADPTLVVASTLILEQDAEAPFPIHIRNQEGLPKNCFVRIQGDLSGLDLSQGHRVSGSAWAVPLGKLTQLTVKRKGTLAEPRPLKVLLVALERGAFRSYASTDVTIYSGADQLARASGAGQRALSVMRAASQLPVGGQEEAGRPADGGGTQLAARPPEGAEEDSGTPAPRPAMSPERRATAEGMVQRGDSLLANGDVDSARLFYERAARLGLSEAAMAMARTFDPAALAEMRVVGMQANPAQARKWYEKALELGAPDAAASLRRLGDSGG
jgi:hypothetical protein